MTVCYLFILISNFICRAIPHSHKTVSSGIVMTISLLYPQADAISP